MITFEFQEDQAYFESLFENSGGLELNSGLFDFREPEVKRDEFSKIGNTMFEILTASYGHVCQLRYHEDCTNKAEQVDHLIPLSSSKLNKELRGIKGKAGKKTPSQSFGSNSENNFVLACARCNAFKKHKIPSATLIEAVNESRNRNNA